MSKFYVVNIVIYRQELAKKWLFWFRRRVGFVCRGKSVFKKCGWEKNKKHRVGNEYWLTRQPNVASFLCPCSPVKMVYSFLFMSVVLLLAGRILYSLPTLPCSPGCACWLSVGRSLAAIATQQFGVSLAQPAYCQTAPVRHAIQTLSKSLAPPPR